MSGVLELPPSPPDPLTLSDIVWLDDTSLTGALIDDTGVVAVDDIVQAAITRALAINTLTGGVPAIGAKPGRYKFAHDLYVPRDVFFVSDTQEQGVVFSFPTETGQSGLGLTNGTQLAGTTTVILRDCTGTWPSSGKAMIGGQIITYTGTLGTTPALTLTGVVGLVTTLGDFNEAVTGFAVTTCQPSNQVAMTVFDEGYLISGPFALSRAAGLAASTQPNFKDGVLLGSHLRLNCTVQGFRHGVGIVGNHQALGRNCAVSNCWAGLSALAPIQSQGDQLIEAGARLDGNYWCSIFAAAENFFSGLVAYRHHGGQSAWYAWKEAGATTFRRYLFQDSYFQYLAAEGWGYGVFGCGDDLSQINKTEFNQCISAIPWQAAARPPATAPQAVIALSLVGVSFTGPGESFFGLMVSADAMSPPCVFKADLLQDVRLPKVDSLITGLTTYGIKFAQGSAGGLVAPSGNTSVSGVFSDARPELKTYFDSCSGSIALGDVVGFRNFAGIVETLQRSEQAVAGVARLAGTAGDVIPVQVMGLVAMNVNPGSAGSVVAPGSITLVRPDTAHNGKVVPATSRGDTNSQAFAWVFSAGDNGTTVSAIISPPLR